METFGCHLHDSTLSFTTHITSLATKLHSTIQQIRKYALHDLHIPNSHFVTILKQVIVPKVFYSATTWAHKGSSQTNLKHLNMLLNSITRMCVFFFFFYFKNAEQKRRKTHALRACWVNTHFMLAVY